MKRILLATLVLLSCYPIKSTCDVSGNDPYLCPDRTAIGFGMEYGSGTYVGTQPIDTIIVKNNGLSTVRIQNVLYSGDAAFSINTAHETDAGFEDATGEFELEGLKYMLVQVKFAPTAGDRYSGHVKIISDVFEIVTISLQGCGVPADGGSSTCYR